MGSYYTNTKFVTELSPKDFDSVSLHLLKRKEPSSMVLFYKPTCPYCQQVKETWKQVGKVTKNFTKFYALNGDKYSDFIFSVREDVPELIKTYPTILAYKNGEPVEKLMGGEKKRHFWNILQMATRNASR